MSWTRCSASKLITRGGLALLVVGGWDSRESAASEDVKVEVQGQHQATREHCGCKVLAYVCSRYSHVFNHSYIVSRVP